MKQATRRFLKLRPEAKLIEKVEHRPNPKYKVGNCIEMAMDVEATPDPKKEKAYDECVKYVPGWIIGDYKNGFTPIMYHYWNKDKDGTHYDTIPNLDQQYEYVMDLGVDDAYKHKGSMEWPPALQMSDTKLRALIGAKLEEAKWEKIIPITLNVDYLDIKELIKIRLELEDKLVNGGIRIEDTTVA